MGKYSATRKRYYNRNRVTILAQKSLYYANNRKRIDHQHRSQQYLRRGLTLEQYNIMLKAQKGRCAICKGRKTTQGHRLAVDHCHTTGKVRALLCDTCNRFLGIYERHRPKFEAYLAEFGHE